MALLRTLLIMLLAAPAWAGGAGDSDAWVGAGIFGLLAAGAFWMFSRSFRRARVIEDTPTAKIASAAQGEVELAGRALGLTDPALVSPLTGTPCLWYSFKVERYQRSGKNSRWVTVSSGRSQAPFAVQDETDRALVHPAGAEVTPRVRRVWRGSSPMPAAPFGADSSFGSYRYTEELIQAGEEVYVLGWFETVQDLGPRPADTADRLRRLKADRSVLLERFDANRDGDISLEEWDAARAAIQEEVRQAFLTAPPAPARHLVSRPRDSDLPFLISGIPQSELAGKYRTTALVGCVGFLMCGAAAVGFALKASGRW